MNHGASGSPIVNANYEICGIYWGGWTSSSWFDPYASIIPSSNLYGYLS
jgi:hypothetical protein